MLPRFCLLCYSSCSKGLFFGNTVEDVFVEVEPILRSALDGHNVCILAYGQTGTGKTFTMVSDKSFDAVVPVVAVYISFIIP